MSPGFARAQGRPKGQITSTAERFLLHSFLCHSSSWHYVVCVYFMISPMYWFMFSTLFFTKYQIQNFCQNTGSRNLSCHGRTGRQRHCNFSTWAALVPVHNFDHNTTSTPSICLFAVVPKFSYRLPIFCVVSSLNCDLSLPIRDQVRQVVVLLIVVSEIVLRIIVDTFDRIGNSPLPPRMQCFLNVVNFRLVLLSHRTVPIDPLLCNFAVSTLLCRDVFNANGHRLVSWSQYPRLFLFFNLTSHILLFLACVRLSVSHPTSQKSRCLSCPLPSDKFSFVAPFPFYWPLRSNLVPHTTSIVPPEFVLPSRMIVGDCWDQPSYSLLWYFATTPYSSMQRRISMSSMPHLVLCHMSTPWLSTCCRQLFLTKRQPQILATLVQYPFILSSLLLLNLNRRLTS